MPERTNRRDFLLKKMVPRLAFFVGLVSGLQILEKYLFSNKTKEYAGVKEKNLQRLIHDTMIGLSILENVNKNLSELDEATKADVEIILGEFVIENDKNLENLENFIKKIQDEKEIELEEAESMEKKLVDLHNKIQAVISELKEYKGNVEILPPDSKPKINPDLLNKPISI